MKKQNGFTLIELVIVIIVLGILAATAVPKFINLQDDAKESAMNGVEAAVHSAANIVYSKASIGGVETTSTVTNLDGVDILFGYPIADPAGIEKAVELSGFIVSVTAPRVPRSVGQSAGTITFVSSSDDAEGDNCVLYTEAADLITPASTSTGIIQNSKCKID